MWGWLSSCWNAVTNVASGAKNEIVTVADDAGTVAANGVADVTGSATAGEIAGATTEVVVEALPAVVAG